MKKTKGQTPIATGQPGLYDPALKSRISRHFRFSPSKPERKMIYQRFSDNTFYKEEKSGLTHLEI